MFVRAQGVSELGNPLGKPAQPREAYNLVFGPLTANSARNCDRDQEDVGRNDEPNNDVKSAVHDYSTQSR